MRDRGRRIELRIERGRKLVALHGRAHAKLGEVPVGDVRTRRLRDDDWIAQHRRAERVRILPDDCWKMRMRCSDGTVLGRNLR